MQNKNKIEKNVMNQINSGLVKMKPRWYFVLGAILTFTGLVISFMSAIFFSNLAIFMIKRSGMQGEWKIIASLASFPVWIPFASIIAFVLGIYFLKKYDFSYRRNFATMVIVVVFAVILGGYILDLTGINDIWSTKGYMRGLYGNSTKQLHQGLGRGQRLLNN